MSTSLVARMGLSLVAVAGLCGASTLTAQTPGQHREPFPSGFTFALGAGRYAVRDDYISSRRYTGTLPYLWASWSHFRGDSGYRLGFGYGNSSKIANYRLSTTINDASLSLDYFYRVAHFRLLSRDARLYLGPSAGFFLYINEPDLGGNVLDLAVSFAALLSAGVNGQVILPLSDRLYAAAALRATVLSLALRMVDLVEDDESPAGLLTPVSGTRATFGFDLHYTLLKHLTIGVGYELAVLRVSAWDHLASASDNLFLQVTIGR